MKEDRRETLLFYIFHEFLSDINQEVLLCWSWIYVKFLLNF